jgi:type I restriction enzyme R subunit
VTTEEKWVKFLSIQQGIQQHPYFEPKYQKSQDEDHRALAFDKIFDEVMLIRRHQALKLNRLVASDAVLKSSLQQSTRGMPG